MTKKESDTAYRQHILDKKLIEHAIFIAGGSETKLAKKAGYSQVAISKALRFGLCGPKLALAIERATNGQVKASDLRPDVFGKPKKRK